jgi:adenylate cyclase
MSADEASLPDGEFTAAEVARHAGVSTSTLRRWVQMGLVPGFDGRWTRTAAAHARIVGRLRRRGHSIEDIKAASDDGRLAFGYLEELFPAPEEGVTIEEATKLTGLEPALIERFYSAIGFGQHPPDRISSDDLELLRYSAAALAAGYPLVAFLQLVRVYGQALATIADAEIRLFHLYVHEPLMHEGVSGLEMAEEMDGLAAQLLPLSSPIMELVHRRYLRHFMEQDIVGHMETDVDNTMDFGRLRVAIAFADLAGYTRLTEEAGEEEALNAVERFVTAVEETLPDDARVIKTIGDEVMVVGSDVAALTKWAVEFQGQQLERPMPRIGVHYGSALYRDGDYFGREVNLAARVVARAAGGEVLVTRPVVENASAELEFEPIGEVRLKGFTEPTELLLARVAED